MCGGYTGEHDEPLEITYVDYTIKMSPYGIQFSDTDPGKLTMKQLERHDFQQGDKFVLYEDTEGLICLKKDRG